VQGTDILPFFLKMATVSFKKITDAPKFIIKVVHKRLVG